MDLFDYMEQQERAARGEEPAPAAPDAVAPPAQAEPTAESPAAALSATSDPVAEVPAGLPLEERIVALDEIAREISGCVACRLCKGRTNTVPGEGNPMTEILFIGEAPGRNEDEQGRPFVGAAGKLLTKIIEAMGFERGEVFIANVCKCRPPENRKPEPDEMAACLPFLRRQIETLRPRVIVAMGKTALEGLFSNTVKQGITQLRGHWRDYEGIAVMPTFHPSYLLRSPDKKRDVWEDMKSVLARLGRTPPPVRKA